MGNASQQTTPHPAQFYRLPTLKQRLGVSGSTLWSWIKQGKFPRGIKISDNVTVWNAADVERWATERIAASQAGK